MKHAQSAQKKRPAKGDNFRGRSLGIRDHRSNKEQRQAYFRHHRLEFVNAWLQLWLTPMATLLSILVMGMAIALPVTLWTLLDNVKMVTGFWDQGTHLVVYFKPDVSNDKAQMIANSIKGNPAISESQFVSKDQGLKELENQLGNVVSLAGMQGNPLPAALKITPVDISQANVQAIKQNFSQYAEVDEIVWDDLWFQRVEAAINFFDRMLFVFLFGLATLIVLVVLTATRLAIHSKAAETKVLKLFGASDAYIRRPFLYAGAWLGFWSAIAALLFASLVINWMAGPAENLLSTYMGSSTFHGIDLMKAFQTLLLGVGLAWLGSWIATAQYLESTR